MRFQPAGSPVHQPALGGPGKLVSQDLHQRQPPNTPLGASRPQVDAQETQRSEVSLLTQLPGTPRCAFFQGLSSRCPLHAPRVWPLLPSASPLGSGSFLASVERTPTHFPRQERCVFLEVSLVVFEPPSGQMSSRPLPAKPGHLSSVWSPPEVFPPRPSWSRGDTGVWRWRCAWSLVAHDAGVPEGPLSRGITLCGHPPVPRPLRRAFPPGQPSSLPPALCQVPSVLARRVLTYHGPASPACPQVSSLRGV